RCPRLRRGRPSAPAGRPPRSTPATCLARRAPGWPPPRRTSTVCGRRAGEHLRRSSRSRPSSRTAGSSRRAFPPRRRPESRRARRRRALSRPASTGRASSSLPPLRRSRLRAAVEGSVGAAAAAWTAAAGGVAATEAACAGGRTTERGWARGRAVGALRERRLLRLRGRRDTLRPLRLLARLLPPALVLRVGAVGGRADVPVLRVLRSRRRMRAPVVALAARPDALVVTCLRRICRVGGPRDGSIGAGVRVDDARDVRDHEAGADDLADVPVLREAVLAALPVLLAAGEALLPRVDTLLQAFAGRLASSRRGAKEPSDGGDDEHGRAQKPAARNSLVRRAGRAVEPVAVHPSPRIAAVSAASARVRSASAACASVAMRALPVVPRLRAKSASDASSSASAASTCCCASLRSVVTAATCRRTSRSALRNDATARAPAAGIANLTE